MKNILLGACLSLTIAFGFDASATPTKAPTKTTTKAPTTNDEKIGRAVTCIVSCVIASVKSRTHRWQLPDMRGLRKCLPTCKAPTKAPTKKLAPKLAPASFSQTTSPAFSPAITTAFSPAITTASMAKECRNPGLWDLIVCGVGSAVGCIGCWSDLACWGRCVGQNATQCLNNRCCQGF